MRQRHRVLTGVLLTTVKVVLVDVHTKRVAVECVGDIAFSISTYAYSGSRDWNRNTPGQRDMSAAVHERVCATAGADDECKHGSQHILGV